MRLASSPLSRAGGFVVLDGLLDGRYLRAMLAEAERLSDVAQESDVPMSDDAERGGSPARRFLSTVGGEVQDAFYRAPWLLRALAHWVGTPIVPSGGRGTFTYYARPGDHLAIHRDVESCELAVVTCLYDAPGRAAEDGASCLYPSRVRESIASIRSEPTRGRLVRRLAPGQTMVMFGGIVPHAVLPVGEGQVRIVSVLCYMPAGVR